MATTSPVPRVLIPGRLARPRARRASRSSRGPIVQALIRTLSNPMGLLGAGLVSLLVISALAASQVSPYDPIEQHPGFELLPPGGQFPLGTDNLGRDLLSRIIFGSRARL